MFVKEDNEQCEWFQDYILIKVLINLNNFKESRYDDYYFRNYFMKNNRKD